MHPFQLTSQDGRRWSLVSVHLLIQLKGGRKEKSSDWYRLSRTKLALKCILRRLHTHNWDTVRVFVPVHNLQGLLSLEENFGRVISLHGRLVVTNSCCHTVLENYSISLNSCLASSETTAKTQQTVFASPGSKLMKLSFGVFTTIVSAKPMGMVAIFFYRLNFILLFEAIKRHAWQLKPDHHNKQLKEGTFDRFLI